MRINSRGFWENHTGKGHHFDDKLSSALVRIFNGHNINSVLDLGCGMGDYSMVLHLNMFKVLAYDGNPHTPKLTNGLGEIADLSQPFDCGLEMDAVLSLEVGEHIPAQFEPVFIDNVCRSKPKMIVLSWAIPKQPGDGHVNCRSNEYIISQLEQRGYKHNNQHSQTLRDASSLPWFQKTIMVFEINLEE